MYRLAIKNDGNDTAYSVQAEVTDIDEKGSSRKNFVPMPLKWTHYGKEIRNILPGQTVYLDVLEHYEKDSNAGAALATRYGGGVDDFTKLKISDQLTVLELAIFQRRGLILKTKVDIAWTAHLLFTARLQGKKKWARDIGIKVGK